MEILQDGIKLFHSRTIEDIRDHDEDEVPNTEYGSSDESDSDENDNSTEN